MPDTLTERTDDGAATIASSVDSSGRSPARTTTRKAQLIRLLERKAGVDAATISAKFSWQPHTTRAALSGLRKAGYVIAAEKPKCDKPARYRIATRPEEAADK